MSKKNTNPFISSQKRLTRAKEHILHLEKRINKFFKKQPYTRLTERDAEGINDLHKVKLIKPIPDSFTGLAVEAIEGLRASLDHAAFTTAFLSGKQNSKSAYFPIAKDVTELDNVIKGRCKDIPQEIITLFRSFNPYKSGNDLIWALNSICNSNKHRMIVPIGIVSPGMHIQHMTFSGPGAIPAPKWDSEKDEIIFAVTSPGTRLQYNLNISFFIAFGEVEAVAGKPMIPLLNAIASEVQRIILAIESEATRIGLKM
jgi:hypothetical protein